MADSWEKVFLGELFDFGSGLSKAKSDFGFGYGFLSFKDVFYNYFVPDKLEQLVNSTEKEQKTCSVRRGDVFLTRTSETQEDLGMSCVALKDYERATFNGFTKRLRPKNPERIVPEYAGYFFRSKLFRQDVTAMSSLSTRASLNNEMLGRLKMLLPPVEDQKAIGRVLKSFDDKIELNRRMNATLEEMARALFKAWFVDFEPVHANKENRPSTSASPEIAKLFPSDFENNIPKGWRMGTLGEVAINHRQNIDPESLDAETPYVGLEHIPRGSIALTEWGNASEANSTKSSFQTNDILFGKLRPYFHKVVIAPVDGICSTDVLVIRPKEPTFFGQTLVAFSSDEVIRYATQLSNGAKMPRTSWFDLAKFQTPVASSGVNREFSRFVKPISEKIKINISESKRLEETRDSLLPRLISGRLSV